MATSKKFSELPAASSVGNGDLFAIAHEDALAETGYVSQKLTAAQAGQKVNGDTEYPTSLPSFPENGQNPFAALEKLNQDIIDLYPVNTASGSIANFSTSLELPLVAMSAEIVAQQASGTPTPSSPLPISGWNSVELTHEYGESESETKTIALGQTVYGGVLDAKSGKLTITWGIIDMGDLTWGYNGTNFYSSEIATKKYGGVNILCSCYDVYATGSISDTPDKTIRGNNSTNRLYLKDIDYTDGSVLKTAVTGQKCIFELATPIEITGLTPANFTTFAGEQNIFADCGDVSVSFKQGIQEYIDAKIAETQALIL